MKQYGGSGNIALGEECVPGFFGTDNCLKGIKCTPVTKASGSPITMCLPYAKASVEEHRRLLTESIPDHYLFKYHPDILLREYQRRFPTEDYKSPLYAQLISEVVAKQKESIKDREYAKEEKKERLKEFLERQEEDREYYKHKTHYTADDRRAQNGLVTHEKLHYLEKYGLQGGRRSKTYRLCSQKKRRQSRRN